MQRNKITDSRWLRHNTKCAKRGDDSKYIPMQYEKLKLAHYSEDCHYHLCLSAAQRKLRNRVSHKSLTLILLTWTIWRAPTNASKWRMGFNSTFKGLMDLVPLKYFGSKDTEMFTAANMYCQLILLL
jgi:hypothetical protein